MAVAVETAEAAFIGLAAAILAMESKLKIKKAQS